MAVIGCRLAKTKGERIMVENTPFKLTNCTVVSLAKKEGINKKTNRPWVLFKFKVDHPKAQGKEFAKFADISKPETWPYEGAKITSMEGTITQSGEYTNYEVSKILYDQTSKPPPAEENPFGEAPSPASSEAPRNSMMPSEGIGKECSVCTSYAMELAKAMIANGFNGSQIDESLGLICDAVGTQGFHLYLHLKAYMEKERAIK